MMAVKRPITNIKKLAAVSPLPLRRNASCYPPPPPLPLWDQPTIPYQRVWQWKDEYGGKITRQIRKLGSSVDWSREAFTMDANLSRA